jgi:hypothetical protein
VYIMFIAGVDRVRIGMGPVVSWRRVFRALGWVGFGGKLDGRWRRVGWVLEGGFE